MSHEALALESVKLMTIRTSTFRILASLNRTRNSQDKVVPVHAVTKYLEEWRYSSIHSQPHFGGEWSTSHFSHYKVG